jgi:shikimate kinase
MNIVLIGYRGTGKTVVGEKLAQILAWPLLRLDDLIVQRAGSSIPDIVKKSGWDYFRDLESQAVVETAKKNSCVIDTGGGVILRQQNVALLKQNGLLFWLKADPDTIVSRIKDDANRPSLTGNKSFVEEVQEILQQRTPLYQQAQDFTIETAERTIDSIADEIVEKYNKRIQKPQTGRQDKRLKGEEI